MTLGEYEPNDEECEWPSDSEDEDDEDDKEEKEKKKKEQEVRHAREIIPSELNIIFFLFLAGEGQEGGERGGHEGRARVLADHLQERRAAAGDGAGARRGRPQEPLRHHRHLQQGSHGESL